jgi:GTP diphosphokinase / guanosine-3',5'-bis(diphosphate) 3'-diphosphatase
VEELEAKLLKDLERDLKKQRRSQLDLELISRSLSFAYKRHKGQVRKSGEPYIVHPAAVAKILIELECDTSTICAGILHDVLEDTKTSIEEFKEEFGEEIYNLVDGVTKLGRLNFKSSKEAQANNFRKMLVAIAQDMRVVLVKVADRLNNMQTLEYLVPLKREQIARETLDIFAPLANRFGLGGIKAEFEDLAFKYLEEKKYIAIKNLVKGKKEERERQIRIVQEKIKQILDSNHIQAEIQGRAKHFYSIYKKLKKTGYQNFDELEDLPIYDLLGIRILVRNVKECYASLGLIHDAFTPVPGRFKDYIAMPKSNMYQSLHTTVVMPWGKPLEVQIRTHEMHEVAERGIAAHWHYKETGLSSQANKKELEKLGWIRQLLNWDTDLSDAEEYLELVKKDIFTQEVYILSPKGDVYSLPAGSCPIDFAYKVHTKVGNACIGAKVNEKIVPLNYRLRNGDLVEIITSKNTRPNLDWINFCKTNQAKHKIKSWYKKQNRDKHIAIAHELFEERFGKDNLEQFIKSDELLKIAQRLNYKTTEDLLAAIGSGDNSVAQVEGKLQRFRKPKQETSPSDLADKFKTRRAPIRGAKAEIPELDGLLYNIAKCCMPIPGEEVIGVISRGKGITIHRSDCRNLKQVENERLMEIDWRTNSAKNYQCAINIEVIDRVGIVKDILTLVADEGINVQDFRVKERPSNNTALLRVILNINGLEQLKKICKSINNLSDVIGIERI